MFWLDETKFEVRDDALNCSLRDWVAHALAGALSHHHHHYPFVQQKDMRMVQWPPLLLVLWVLTLATIVISEEILVQLDDDNHDDDAPMETFEYKYDEEAIHEQWHRDLVWNDALDQEIRSRHEGYADLADTQRRLQADGSTDNDFVKSLYQGDPNEEVSCFIGYKTLKGRQEIIRAVFAVQSKHYRHDFGEVNSIAVTLPKWKLIELIEDLDHIDFIEQDQEVMPNQIQSQVTPYGIPMTQGGTTYPNNRPSSCQRPGSFKVAIVDAGFDVGHPDLTCSTVGASNCLGR